MEKTKTASKRVVPSKKEAQDLSIMNTNSSCIVSKRSVEKLYHRKDYGFRHFVKKFQRRSPLINRGYWLRMRAIDEVVRAFLLENTTAARQKRAVVNLGCGYDVLPFRCLSEHNELCRDTLFVDVDYRDLMTKKCTVLNEHPSLLRDCGRRREDACTYPALLLNTAHYAAVGCDLTDTRSLDHVLRELLGLTECTILFIAEVSMTYMGVEAADQVLRWAASFHSAQFCMLEQCLPDGRETPFVSTMLKHFEKLHSPLRTIHQYPTVQDQESRFISNGWAQAQARTLWSIWLDEGFLSNEAKEALDFVEPFDEWEEFALFGCHYFMLIARTKSPPPSASTSRALTENSSLSFATSFSHDLRPTKQRRHGASFRIGSNAIAHHGGLGSRGRLSNTDIVIDCSGTPESSFREGIEGFAGPSLGDLMCHTITSLSFEEALLVGGRTSPERASATCLQRKNGIWTAAQDVPHACFRHSAARVRLVVDQRPLIGVLVFGGKTQDGKLVSQWLLWLPEDGWRVLETIGETPEPRFGAAMCSEDDSGYITGGMNLSSKVFQDLWKWGVIYDGRWKIMFANVTCQLSCDTPTWDVFGRFGAVLLPDSENLYLIGGISQSYVRRDSEVLKVDRDRRVSSIALVGQATTPFLVGHSAELIDCKGSYRIIILGGGATCFSFGTHWNQGCYTVSVDSRDVPTPWQPYESGDSCQRAGSELGPAFDGSPTATREPSSPAPRIQLDGQRTFERILATGRPVIMEHLQLGSCINAWTPEYLKGKIGKDRGVVIHNATATHMNFLDKNFSYQTRPFGEFIDGIEVGEKWYLRALSAERPADRPANLERDFPSVAPDFVLPSELAAVIINAHSSPLRISGQVIMWLHYDVMANVYCQVRGRKRLVLFQPHQVTDLQFPPGASSSRLEVFDPNGNLKPHFENFEPVICDLGPGDVLFIPAVWPHSAFPIGGSSIAVNVFFRSLQSGYSPGRDIYGNRDVQAYETGRKDVQRVIKAFDGHPKDMSRFYLKRLAVELEQAAEQM